MKLYELTDFESDAAFIVRAPDARTARQMAYDITDGPWLDQAESSCRELTVEGEPCIILQVEG